MENLIYNATEWKAGREGGTAWTPERLNNIEGGISQVTDRANVLSKGGGIEITEEDYNELPESEKKNGSVYYVSDDIDFDEPLKAEDIEMLNGNTVEYEVENIKNDISTINSNFSDLADIVLPTTQPIKIGTFNGLSMMRQSFVLTGDGLKDGQLNLSPLSISGGQIVRMYGMLHYDNNNACIPLGQLASSGFGSSIGVNNSRIPYIILSTSNRASRIYLFIEYWTN